MWGKGVKDKWGDTVEFVALCDPNPKRAEVVRQIIGVTCPVFTDFDRMVKEARPDVVAITTVDAYHAEYIIRALDLGIDVITEKPMMIDEKQTPGGASTPRSATAQDHRRAQHAVRAGARADQGTDAEPAGGADPLGGLPLVPGHEPRHRLLPALAWHQGQERLALGAQGDAPLRLRELAARRRAGAGAGLRRHQALRQGRARSGRPTAAPARTRRSARSTGT